MNKTIGVVGGMGPYAGIELVKNILNFTNARKDQEHIPLVHLSLPNEIEDRTLFLLGLSPVNPATSVKNMICKLEDFGAQVIGIACNTCHAPEIFNEIISSLEAKNSSVHLVNMVDETIAYIKSKFEKNTSIGILSTNGTYMTSMYKDKLKAFGYKVIVPDLDFQQNVIHKCIYDPRIGLKSVFNPISSEAKELLEKSFNYFKKKSADVVILGCSEISFAAIGFTLKEVILVDPLKILAQSLIIAAAPNKLRSDKKTPTNELTF